MKFHQLSETKTPTRGKSAAGNVRPCDAGPVSLDPGGAFSQPYVIPFDLMKVCDTLEITKKGFYVYKGLPKEKEGWKLLYIGTTIQVPADRFRWHKANGKDFRFEIIKICKDENEMLETEFNLIRKYNPKFNKITKRKQNFNKKLTDEEKYSRVGNKEWCQCCLTRRVNKGYEFCFYCA